MQVLRSATPHRQQTLSQAQLLSNSTPLSICFAREEVQYRLPHTRQRQYHSHESELTLHTSWRAWKLTSPSRSPPSGRRLRQAPREYLYISLVVRDYRMILESLTASTVRLIVLSFKVSSVATAARPSTAQPPPVPAATTASRYTMTYHKASSARLFSTSAATATDGYSHLRAG